MASADRDALLALYRSTDGPSWRRMDNWGTDAALSDCYGVEVNDEGRVVGLNLGWNINLRGIFRPTLRPSRIALSVYLAFSKNSYTEIENRSFHENCKRSRKPQRYLFGIVYVLARISRAVYA